MAELSVVAKRLREARLRARLSQRQLGIKAGIDPFAPSARINQYERGKHTPDVGTAARLARDPGVRRRAPVGASIHHSVAVPDSRTGAKSAIQLSWQTKIVRLSAKRSEITY